MIYRLCLFCFTLWLSLFPAIAKAEIKDCAFREYDIRGHVGSEIDLDEVYDLSRAIACYYTQKNPDVKTLALGMDGRISSPAISDKVCSGLLDSGIDVVWIGLCTSPILYYANESLDVDGGVMITASHNPKGDNGLKLCMNNQPICGEELQEIKRLFKQRRYLNPKSLGTLQSHDMTQNYTSWLTKHFKHLKDKNHSVLFDCGNGAAGVVLPHLIESLQWDNAGLLYSEVDGNFPNRNSDPTKQENLKGLADTLRTTSFDFGIAFDGDGDRMVAMTKDGSLVPGDKLLAIFGKQVAKNNPRAGVVFDLSCSTGLQELLSAAGALPIMAPIGAVNVRKSMEKYQALLGGEISCHFFFKDRHFGFDDGIYAALRLVETMEEFGQSLDELIEDFPQKFATPTIRFPCKEEQKDMVVSYFKEHFMKRNNVSLVTLDGVRVAFERGWGLIRPSNTEPKLSLRFEADTPEDLTLIKKEFSQILEKFFDAEIIKTYMD
ncbi:MAG: phosphomannomutase/phosphoglucomutase [Chlamydiota bacterium]